MTERITQDPETYAIIGAAMEVHSILGHGFLEKVYVEAMANELGRRNIQFKREVELPVYYKGDRLSTTYRADLICFGSVIVELKALQRLGNAEDSQVLNYLKASALHRGLLLNFGTKQLQFERLVWNFEQDKHSSSAD